MRREEGEREREKEGRSGIHVYTTFSTPTHNHPHIHTHTQSLYNYYTGVGKAKHSDNRGVTVTFYTAIMSPIIIEIPSSPWQITMLLIFCQTNCYWFHFLPKVRTKATEEMYSPTGGSVHLKSIRMLTQERQPQKPDTFLG